jgi:ABC-2 type transport system permease protein/lipopolysaccharide transport system permease protein
MTTATEPSPRHDTWRGYAALDAPFHTQFGAALSDVREGLRRHRNWRYLAVESIKNQYRRTVLGPWWITLQTASYVLGLALIFGQLLHAPLRSFLPYVAIGFVTFVLLQGLTRAASVVFVSASSSLKSTRQPLMGLVLRDVTIEVIQFAHNFLICLVFIPMGLLHLHPSTALALPVLLLIVLNGVALGLWLGPLVARFRDVGPAVLSVLQVLVFFTPVFYRRSNLHGVQATIINDNPFTYLIEAFREPLLGVIPGLHVWTGVVIVSLVNGVLGLVVFSRTRSRLPYWVA